MSTEDWTSCKALDEALNKARHEFLLLRGLIFAMKALDGDKDREASEAMGSLVEVIDHQAQRLYAVLDPLADGCLPGHPLSGVEGARPKT